MWSPSMCKYNLLNDKFKDLRATQKSIIVEMWELWGQMGENERAHFLEQHEVECNCDAPPSEQ